MRFQTGDWVELQNMDSNLNGVMGYVKETKNVWGNSFPEVLFTAIRRKNGERMTGERWVLAKQCKYLPKGLTEKDVDQLIDLALDLNEKEWFMELVEKKKEGQKDGSIPV